jgi:hypothetical protein
MQTVLVPKLPILTFIYTVSAGITIHFVHFFRENIFSGKALGFVKIPFTKHRQRKCQISVTVRIKLVAS